MILTCSRELGSITAPSPGRDLAIAKVRRLVRSKLPSCDKVEAAGTKMAFGACHVRTAILSPSPRAWPFDVGRSRYADRLRPSFFVLCQRYKRRRDAADRARSAPLLRCKPHQAIRWQQKRRSIRAGASQSERCNRSTAVKALLGARSACARAAALCVRKTALG